MILTAGSRTIHHEGGKVCAAIHMIVEETQACHPGGRILPHHRAYLEIGRVIRHFKVRVEHRAGEDIYWL